MSGWRGRGVWTAILVAAAVAVPSGAAAQTRGPEGYELDASAAALQVLYDDLDAPSPVHPTGQGSIPYTAARLASGPSGHAVASVAWPGPVVANVGTVATVVGAPDGAVPNYPLRAESSWPQGPPDASNTTVPGATMTAHSKDTRSRGDAAVSGFGVPRLVSVGALASDATTLVQDGLPSAEATASASELNLLDGLVTVRSVRTVTRVTNDGARPTTAGRTVVSGLVVAGVALELDEKGAGGDRPPPGLGVTDPVERQMLDQAGVRVLLAQPEDDVRAGRARRSAGGLVIAWSSPDRRRSLVVGVGAATVGVGAARHTASEGGGTAGAGADDGPGPPRPEEAIPPASGVEDSTLPAPAEPPAVPALLPAATSASPPVAAFAGIGTGLVLLALALAAVGGAGLRRASEGAGAVAGDGECPGERGPP